MTIHIYIYGSVHEYSKFLFLFCSYCIYYYLVEFKKNLIPLLWRSIAEIAQLISLGACGGVQLTGYWTRNQRWVRSKEQATILEGQNPETLFSHLNPPPQHATVPKI